MSRIILCPLRRHLRAEPDDKERILSLCQNVFRLPFNRQALVIRIRITVVVFAAPEARTATVTREVEIVNPDAAADEMIRPFVPVRAQYAIAVGGWCDGLTITSNLDTTVNLTKSNCTGESIGGNSHVIFCGCREKCQEKKKMSHGFSFGLRRDCVPGETCRSAPSARLWVAVAPEELVDCLYGVIYQ